MDIENEKLQDAVDGKPCTEKDDKKAPKHPPVPPSATASLVWDGPDGAITYEATAGHLKVTADDGKPMAQMFHRSYVATAGVKDPASPSARARALHPSGFGFSAGDAASSDWFRSTRPVTFCFNGGPGCASVPLDFGGIGPVRAMPDGTRHLTTPAKLQHNPACILPLTDIVFLDAPGTGWSFVESERKGKKIWGVDGDADAFARAIQVWLTENRRWNSPVFLFGESYGTVRNAVLARILGEKGVGVSGVVQLSTIYDWASTLPGNDAYYMGMTPVYAAAAQWFGKVGEGTEPNRWFDEACVFVNERLCPALVMGDRLDDEREESVAVEMSSYVGLSPEYLRAHHLRVELEDFRRELLRDEGRVMGRLDLRFTGDAVTPVQGSTEFIAGEDAADDALEAVWTGAFRALMDRIGYVNPAPYVSTNWKVNESWNWIHQAPGTLESVPAPNVALDMGVAMRRNPSMRVCYIGGRYDAATPYWNLIHDTSALFLPDGLRKQQEFHLYGCGHMSYVDEETLEAMARDLRAFYAKALQG